MKRIAYFIVMSLCVASCTKNSINNSPPCQNEPPTLGMVIVKNEVPYNRYLNDYKLFKKEAILYKLSGNKKVKIEDLDVYNENIFIFGAEKSLKTFYTNSLETFYVEYQNKMDTLQIKGIYYKNEECGDMAYLLEIHFNGKQIDLKQNMIDHLVYKIDNTNSNSEAK